MFDHLKLQNKRNVLSKAGKTRCSGRNCTKMTHNLNIALYQVGVVQIVRHLGTNTSGAPKTLLTAREGKDEQTKIDSELQLFSQFV